MCKLEYPGKPRREIDPILINDRLSAAFQYACRYWIQHATYGEVEICNGDDVCVFLQKHFLHWLEGMSLINRLAEVIEQIRVLQSLVSVSNRREEDSDVRGSINTILGSQMIRLIYQISSGMRSDLSWLIDTLSTLHRFRSIRRRWFSHRRPA